MASKMNIFHLIAVLAVLSSTSVVAVNPVLSSMDGMDLSQMMVMGLNAASNYFNSFCPGQAAPIKDFVDCVQNMTVVDIPSFCGG
jgi:hypothetical protein